ncbi:uncharacterized protein LOC112045789 [Bicyclus anynana]|uniref:Uncharacterized protein LOC112045789 n=1 Tax=Bicyclus anynana TaxID=110368 RepID=A0A6J1MYH7_BICAN|nr:uncharacterized protein LOC112045789 [Bicyclus anynana]
MSTKISAGKKTKRETSKDDIVAKKPEEKLKNSIYSVSTPRNFVQKPLAADIYARKSNVQSLKASKKLSSPNKTSNESPMKDLLKSSPSNVSLTSTKSYRVKPALDSKLTAKPNAPSSRHAVTKKLPFTNSPIAKKRLNVDDEQKKTKDKKTIDNKDVKHKDKKRSEQIQSVEVVKRKEIVNPSVVLPERKRTKTRTLDDEEIKILTPDVVDNNLEMLNMNKKLTAQPKAFYVDLNVQKPKPPQKALEQKREIEEEVDYEDDFESYESDFDSYQSESLNDDTSLSNDSRSNNDDDGDVCKCHDDHSFDSNLQESDESHLKEERMLDSGNFELPDPRSAGKTKPMDHIVEGSEDIEKRVSLTDEGFQDMTGSGLSSMKTLHVDVLDRPLFIDFTKSKVNRRKRKIFERLKQRADDILSMVTLHEMSYDLYEMKPIPYDLYMATFGRFNYTQTAVQTFDDGITEEVQTDEIVMTDKWTQNPIEFSNNYHFNTKTSDKINKRDSVDNFEFLIHNVQDDANEIIDESYFTNPLRIYLEQKDGVSTNKMLPYENYKKKLKNVEYEPKKLRKFLKKMESRVSNILNKNSGNSLSNLNQTSKFPFSKEYLLISNTNMTEDYSFLNNTRIIAAIYSDTKTNMIAMVHSKLPSKLKKCVISLWDLGVAMLKPLKILIATDDVTIGRFRGSISGFIVGGLCDGSILLWDLSEEPTWFDHDTTEEDSEIDLKVQSGNKCDDSNKNGNIQTLKKHTLQASSYTSSAFNVCNNLVTDKIVGLEFMGENSNVDHDRRVLVQLCALQSIGILTIWSIIQEKARNFKHELGKALWSKMKLERNQTINLMQYIEMPIQDIEMANLSFNLNTAKKRMLKKRNERHKYKITRPKSAILKDESKRSIDCDSWGNGVVCNHLKVMKLNGVENFLVAKCGGEVLCCKRDVGSVRVKVICIAGPVSSVTCIELSPHGLPYFLAATDCGTVNMCSLIDYRVLLTLDCRNGPSLAVEKCLSDSKGRYLGSVSVSTGSSEDYKESKLPITSIAWLHPNPFCITATLATGAVVWVLTHSDMRAKCRGDGLACTTNGRSLALLTMEGVQVYKLTDTNENCLDLFQKYVALL